jgi:sugar fermentation stimulation protein A
VAAYRFSTPLLQGTLLRRYKRFFVDVRLRNGHTVVAHTSNTGSMKSCSEPGSRVFVSRAENRDRKLRYTLEIVETGGTLVGVNTLMPNRLVEQAVRLGEIPELAGYAEVRREVQVGESRIDLMCSVGPVRCYVEIKNVSLVEGGVARFPDAVTERGRRHLDALQGCVEAGHRAVIFFLVQRSDCSHVEPADAIDPAYGRALRRVTRAGVEPLAYRADVTPEAITLGPRLPVHVAPAASIG